MAVRPLVRRAMLYVPSSSSKMLLKSRNLTVDCVAYDLEDSVLPDQKQHARESLGSFLQSLGHDRPKGIREIAVRVNATDTKHIENDLEGVVNIPGLNTIVLPKVQTAADIRLVTEAICHVRQDHGNSQSPISIVALIETAKGLLNVNEICAASPLISGLVFAAEDFCHDLSITRTPSLTELLFARSTIVTAARAHEISSVIDLVTTSFRGEEGIRHLELECTDGKRLGFNGKQLIHPSQIEVAQSIFSPSQEELIWAVKVMIGDAKALADQARGAWALDGKMIDVPVVKKAKAVVAKAEACGMDVQSLRSTWKDLRPE
ncbi:citrate lyase subunit beta [Fusarium globosum]|uniref:Citrate lyase subunit beta n=1 Tax=Fusarium globosum TaxID=78864 RepID=A0A8H5Y6P0_9HYPO|nr:citrate lyase subunit beta [Fusarium globosum]